MNHDQELTSQHGWREAHEISEKLQVLLSDYPGGIPAVSLQDMYQKKFGKSLILDLLKLICPDSDGLFVWITQRDEEHNTITPVLSLRSSQSDEQELELALKEVTASGLVPFNFQYEPNEHFRQDNGRFLGWVSNINRNDCTIHVQPEDCTETLSSLTEELNAYYSNRISENFRIKDIAIGLACAAKYNGIYHRVYVKESHRSSCVVLYVDLGLTEEVQVNEGEFKYLLNCFGLEPCIAIPCRLLNVQFKLRNDQMAPEIYNELNQLCQFGLYRIEPFGCYNGALNVKIYDEYSQCLNDIVVEKGLASSSVYEVPSTSSGSSKGAKARKGQRSHLSSGENSDGNTTCRAQRAPEYDLPRDTQNRGLMGDYITTDAASTEASQLSTPPLCAYDEYEVEDYSGSPCSTVWKAPDLIPGGNNPVKSSHQSSNYSTGNKRDPNRNSHYQNSRNQDDQKKRVWNSRRMPFGGRLFKAAISGVSQEQTNRRQSSHKSTSTSNKDDEFNDWMCSSCEKHSLWSNPSHKTALLTYIGRIYGQRSKMYRIYTQLRNERRRLDELDVLHELIERTKGQHSAQTSLNEWEEMARVDRRLKDLQIIFEFNRSSNMRTGPFTVTPPQLSQIIDRQNIRSYFDLGCGNGVITAALGRYLNLSQEAILGGDIYESKNDAITFVKVDENQTNIDLPDKWVDLITTFVTFHHVSQVEKTLGELVRILRPGGYLILREHDCKDDYSLTAKYLNFIHAIMMIARVGEFAADPYDSNDDTVSWEEQKLDITRYLRTIHYRASDEWDELMKGVGFKLCAKLSYDADGSSNPQKLFYAIYRLSEA